jgi:hypothetical protein
MPSDPRAARVLEMLADATAQYRSALALTLEEMRGYVEAGRSDADARSKRLEAQLGAFGAERLDAARLAALVGDRQSLDASALQRVERASSVVRALLDAGDGLFQVVVPQGGNPFTTVSAQLAAIGRAFAAARVASAACNRGAASGLDEAVALDRFPFGEWSPAERMVAPPLLVTVNGADLVAGALAPFVDGRQKILLIVEGACAPAPLVRLITPGVLVIQAHDPKELEPVARWAGAAVAALVPSSAVRFVHDPAAGREIWQRITMPSAPEARLSRIGGLTIAQQASELRQLELLAAPPAANIAAEPIAAPAATADAADSADRLAAWLLQQAALTAAPGPRP